MILTIPPCSPIFIIPDQNAKTPVRPREISNPVFDISKVAVTISEKVSTLPRKISLNRAIPKAITKKKIQR
jgi:hypothetical protein